MAQHEKTADPGSLNLALNARFGGRAVSGVDRVAQQIVTACGNLMEETGCAASTHVAMPFGMTCYRTESAYWKTAQPVPGRLRGHLWEQFELPWVQPDSVLLNLCNSGSILRKRQVVMIHDAQIYLNPESYSTVFRSWYRIMLPALGQRAKVVATVSNYSKVQLERFGVVPRDKAVVVYNGSDHIDHITEDDSIFARHKITKESYLFAVGSLAPHKNLARLMQAAAKRSTDAPELIIAGGGNKTVFRDAGLEPPYGVRMLGHVSDGELKALYSHALALVFPSITEGFGLPPVEAMRCGCPVIATTGGAVPEVCGEAALLVDPFEPERWTEAMNRIVSDQELRETLTRAGRERAGVFTWRRAAATLLAAICNAEADHDQAEMFETIAGNNNKCEFVQSLS